MPLVPTSEIGVVIVSSGMQRRLLTEVSSDVLRSNVSVNILIIWLAPWAGKINQILRCDWLRERARWDYLARSGLPAAFRKRNFPEGHIINPLLTKLVRSRWLDVGLVLFLRVYGPRLRLGPWTRKGGAWPISSHLDLTLGQ